MKLFKVNNKRIRYLEKEELARLVNTCPNYLRPIVIVAFNTGMRKSEILHLKRSDIDFRNKIIYLVQTKNREVREIPMTDLVFKTLLKVRKNPNSPYVFCKKDGHRRRKPKKKQNLQDCQSLGIMRIGKDMPEWRNRETRWTQNPKTALLRNPTKSRKSNRDEIFHFFCLCTFLVKIIGICTNYSHKLVTRICQSRPPHTSIHETACYALESPCSKS